MNNSKTRDAGEHHGEPHLGSAEIGAIIGQASLSCGSFGTHRDNPTRRRTTGRESAAHYNTSCAHLVME